MYVIAADVQVNRAVKVKVEQKSFVFTSNYDEDMLLRTPFSCKNGEKKGRISTKLADALHDQYHKLGQLVGSSWLVF